MQRHVVSHVLALGDEVVILNREGAAEIVLDRCDDLFPTVTALSLRPGGMIHHVLRDEFADDLLIAGRSATKELFHHALRVRQHSP